MTADTLEERRKYVAQVKASFQNPAESTRYGDVHLTEEPDRTDVLSGAKGGWKWRLVAALLLFGGFIYLSQNQIKVGQMTAAEVAAYLSEDFAWEKVLDKLPGAR